MTSHPSIRSRFNLSSRLESSGAVCSYGGSSISISSIYSRLPRTRSSVFRSQPARLPKPRNSRKKQGVDIYIMLIRTNYVSFAFQCESSPRHLTPSRPRVANAVRFSLLTFHPSRRASFPLFPPSYDVMH